MQRTSLAAILVFIVLSPLALSGEIEPASGQGPRAAIPASDTRSYLGDAASAAVYAHSGPQAGAVLGLHTQKSRDSLFELLTPMVIQGEDVSTPTRGVSDGGITESGAALSFAEGTETAHFAHTLRDTRGAQAVEGARASAALSYIQDGVYLWQVSLSNSSADARVFELGLAMHTGAARKLASFKASDAQLLLLVGNQALAIGGVSAWPLAYTPALRGAPLALLPAEIRQGSFFLGARVSLEAAAEASVSFIIALGGDSEEAGKKCAEWMRLAGLGALREKKEELWQAWLALGRAPELRDASLRQSLFRALSSLDVSIHHEALCPSDANVLLDAAEALRAFGRDASAAHALSRASSVLTRRGKSLNAFIQIAGTEEGRETLMRYVSLASRLTITSGKLAGELDLVRLALDALVSAALERDGSFSASPSEAVMLAAACNDGALLTHLSRDEKGAASIEKNAVVFQDHRDRLYSGEMLSWTGASGMPDVRVFATGTFLQGRDARFAGQYHALRPLFGVLSPRERVFLLGAAAENLDRKYFRDTFYAGAGASIDEATDASAEASISADAEMISEPLAGFPPARIMALRLLLLGGGALYASLDEREAYSDYRLESLYRVLLELRHTSRHAAASFIFRDLRARIRAKLDNPRERDDAFLGSLALDCEKLRDELEKYALTAPLERSLTLARLDQAENIILAMIFARRGQYPSARCVAADDGVEIYMPASSRLGSLPSAWSVASTETRAGGQALLLLRQGEQASAPEFVAIEHRIAVGGEEQRWSERLLLSHPNPLTVYILPRDPLNGSLVLHNRDWRPVELVSLQCSAPVIRGEVPFRIGAECAANLALDMAPDAESVRILLVILENGAIRRIECRPPISESAAIDSVWYRLSANGAQLGALSLDAASLADLEADFPENGLRITKVLDTPADGRERVFGICSAESPWTISLAGQALTPLQSGEWRWYALGAHANLRLTATFSNYSDLVLFAESAKRVVSGKAP